MKNSRTTQLNIRQTQKNKLVNQYQIQRIKQTMKNKKRIKLKDTEFASQTNCKLQKMKLKQVNIKMSKIKEESLLT